MLSCTATCKGRKKKKMMSFYNFPRITVAIYFMEFKSIIVY